MFQNGCAAGIPAKLLTKCTTTIAGAIGLGISPTKSFSLPFEFVERKTTQLRVCALMKNLVASSLTPRMMQFSAVVVVPLAQATHFSGYETKSHTSLQKMK
ncbi:hypothetical protein EMCRGX_G020636 [Ephydatia muelleri]